MCVTLCRFVSIISATPSSQCSSSNSNSSSMTMVRVALLVLALTTVCNGILPEIVDSGLILEENSAPGQTELDRMFVEVEQLPEEKKQKTEV